MALDSLLVIYRCSLWYFFPRYQAIEYIRVQVGAIRPKDRPPLRVNIYFGKEAFILERLKYASEFDKFANIHFTSYAIFKFEM